MSRESSSPELFWALIENAACSASPQKSLHRALSALDFAGLVCFEMHMRNSIVRACTQRIAAAAYIMLGFLTDDALEDFAAWLILGGRQRFENAIREPGSIASYPPPADGPVAEWLHTLPTAIAELGGREEELDELLANDLVEPAELGPLPSDPRELTEEFPLLFEKYWKHPWRPRN